jgi:hypothetical protein
LAGEYVIGYNSDLNVCAKKQDVDDTEAKECSYLHNEYKRLGLSPGRYSEEEIKLRLEYSDKCIHRNCWDEAHCVYMKRWAPDALRPAVQKYCDVADANKNKLGPIVRLPKKHHKQINPQEIADTLDSMIQNAPLLHQRAKSTRIADLYRDYITAIQEAGIDIKGITTRVNTLTALLDAPQPSDWSYA